MHCLFYYIFLWLSDLKKCKSLTAEWLCSIDLELLPLLICVKKLEPLKPLLNREISLCLFLFLLRNVPQSAGTDGVKQPQPPKLPQRPKAKSPTKPSKRWQPAKLENMFQNRQREKSFVPSENFGERAGKVPVLWTFLSTSTFAEFISVKYTVIVHTHWFL